MIAAAFVIVAVTVVAYVLWPRSRRLRAHRNTVRKALEDRDRLRRL